MKLENYGLWTQIWLKGNKFLILPGHYMWHEVLPIYPKACAVLRFKNGNLLPFN